MKIGYRGEEWERSYPIYLNPSFDEILKLAQSGWDTIRIATDEANIIMASGLGNTHTNLAEAYHAGKKKYECGLLDVMILYHVNGIAYMNMEDVGGPERARHDRWSRVVDDAHEAILKDLIRESGLAL